MATVRELTARFTASAQSMRSTIQATTRELKGLQKTSDQANKRMADGSDSTAKALGKLESRIERLSGTHQKQVQRVNEANNSYRDMSREYGKNSQEALKAKENLDKQVSSYNALRNKLREATNDYARIRVAQETQNSLFTKTANVLETYSGKVRSFGEGITNIGQGLTNKITKPALVATTAVTGLVGALGFKRLIGMDNAQAKLKGLGIEGKQLETVMLSAKEAVTGTTHTMAEGADAAAGALASGVKEGKELTRHLKLIGDAATGSNRPMSEMAMIFNRIEGAGKLMGNELDMIEHGMPGFSAAMAKHLKVPQDEFRKMVSEGKVSSKQFKDVMEDFAGGMSAAYAETWEGMTKNVLSNIGIIGEALLSGLFEDGKKGLADFLTVLRSDGLKEWAKETGEQIRKTTHEIIDGVRRLKKRWDELNPSIQDAIKKIALFGGATSLVLGPVLIVVGKVVASIGAIGTAIVPALKWLGKLSGVFKTASTAAGTKGLAGGVARIGPSILGLSGPIGWIVGALVALTGVFVTLWNKSDSFRSLMIQIFDDFKDTVIKDIESWKESFESVKDAIGAFGSYTGEQLNKVKDAFNRTKVGGWFKKFKEEHIDGQKAVDTFRNGVSKATKGILEKYVELSEQASKQLTDLRWDEDRQHRERMKETIDKYKEQGEKVPKQLEENYKKEMEKLVAHYDQLASTYDELHKESLTQLESHHKDRIKEIEKHLADSWSITDADKEKLLQDEKESHEKSKYRMEENNKAIQGILERAKKENRELTKAEMTRIEELQTEHNAYMVKEVSEGEREQEIILSRMNNNKRALNREYVEQIIADSEEARKKVVEEAEQKRDETIAFALDEFENNENFSSDMRDALISDAEETYNRTVEQAENRHQDIIKEASAQAEEHGIIVDEETGKILSSWDVFGIKLKKKVSEIWNDFLNEGLKVWDEFYKFADWLDEIGYGITDSLERMNIRAGEKITEFLDGIKAKWQEFKTYTKEHSDQLKEDWNVLIADLSKRWNDFWTGVVNYFVTKWNEFKKYSKEHFEQLKNDWNTLKDEVIRKTKEMANGVKQWFVDLYTNARNKIRETKNKVINTAEDMRKGAVNKFNGLVTGAKDMMDGVKKWIDNKRSAVITSATSLGVGIANAAITGFNKMIGGINKVASLIGVDNLVSPIPKIGSGGSSTGGGASNFVRLYSRGTDYHTGGHAIVGDKGIGNAPGMADKIQPHSEIVKLPNGKQFLFNEATFIPNMPRGTKVINGRDTNALLGSGGGFGKFVNKGIAFAKNLVRSPIKAITETASSIKNVVGNVFDYMRNPRALVDRFLDNFDFGFELPKEALAIAQGSANKMKSGITNLFTDWFRKSTVADGSYILNRAITQRFGRYTGGLMFNGGNHYGVDTLHRYDPLYSPVNGTVTRRWNDYGGGLSLEIKSGDMYWWFMHLSRAIRNIGDQIKIGDRLGTTGNTGNFTTGAHLHTQAMKGAPGNHNAVDPLPLLRQGMGGYYEGGITSGRPELAWLNEEGFKESIISWNPARKERSERIWNTTGNALGFKNNMLSDEMLRELRMMNNWQEKVYYAIEHGMTIQIDGREIAVGTFPHIDRMLKSSKTLKERY